MSNPFAAAMPAFLAAFGELVTYEGAGLAEPTDLGVIWSDVSGEPFQGPGNTTRTVSFEIDKALLPQRPGKSNRITRKGIVWQPQEVADRDDIGKWVVFVEKSA